MERDNRRANTVCFIALCSICIILSSCATMFAPGQDEITITSEPEGAEVYDGAHLLGKTPLTRAFVRDTFENKELTVKMEGYKSEKLYLAKTIEKTALLNFGYVLTTFGATSWGIDAVTGHMIKYSPDSYLIFLEKEENAAGKVQSYQQRLRFAVVNHDCLKKDIAKGRGEYLRAFYEIGLSERPFDHYQSFLCRVSSRAGSLLAMDDPLEFHRELEGMFHAVSLSPNGARWGRP